MNLIAFVALVYMTYGMKINFPWWVWTIVIVVTVFQNYKVQIKK